MHFGKAISTNAVKDSFQCLIKKSDISHVEKLYDIPQTLKAPVFSDKAIGKVTYVVNGKTLGNADIYSDAGVESLTRWYLLGVFIRAIIS